MAVDVYSIVTQRILEQLKKGVVPWRKTWNGAAPMNYISRKVYRGINLILLPFGGEFLSFKQCSERGGKVKKGEKGNIVVFFKMIEKTDDDTGEKETFPLLRYSTVFHLSQCEGVESKLQLVRNDIDPIESAQIIVDNYCRMSSVKLKHIFGSNRACYRHQSDEVVLPERSQFESSAEYYSTLFHELAHSTGHISRLNREDKSSKFGGSEYSKEELVAEIASAALMSVTGIEIPASFENSVSYIDGWVKVLGGDKKFIIAAATQAQKASDLILGIQASVMGTTVERP